jgi:hypothetical protein
VSGAEGAGPGSQPIDEDLLARALVAAMRDEENRSLARSILGTAEVEPIAERVVGFCRHVLGSPVAGFRLLEFSTGAAFGLVLADGRKVFLKFHAPEVSLAEARAVAQVQGALAAGGFPCPSVLREPSEFQGHVVSADDWVDVGERRDAHLPEIRRAMAGTLADLVARAEPWVGTPGLRREPSGDEPLWPRPHNALFDFSRAATGAAWIDAIARRAKESLSEDAGALVVGHMDWSAKHFRFSGAEVCMIYDWESLRVADECVVVGSAAATFPVTWDLDVRITPTAEESAAFVAEYESARPRSFSARERRRVSAAATYTIAYVSRCEHALDPEGARIGGSFREILAQASERDYVPLAEPMA